MAEPQGGWCSERTWRGRHGNAAAISANKTPGVVVLVGTKGFLVGTGDVSRHRLGGIRLQCPWLGDATATIRHGGLSMSTCPVASRLGGVGVGLAGQQGVWIGRWSAWVLLLSLMRMRNPHLARFLPGFGVAKALARNLMAVGGGSSLPVVRSSEAWMHRPAAGCHPTEKCSVAEQRLDLLERPSASQEGP